MKPGDIITNYNSWFGEILRKHGKVAAKAYSRGALGSVAPQETIQFADRTTVTLEQLREGGWKIVRWIEGR